MLLERLTAREGQILGLVTAGRSSDEIAVALGIRKRTVDAHRCDILAKLDVSLPKARRLGMHAGMDRQWLGPDESGLTKKAGTTQD